jgi:hypothetical protein
MNPGRKTNFLKAWSIRTRGRPIVRLVGTERDIQILGIKSRKNKALDRNQCSSTAEAVTAWIGLLPGKIRAERLTVSHVVTCRLISLKEISPINKYKGLNKQAVLFSFIWLLGTSVGVFCLQWRDILLSITKGLQSRSQHCTFLTTKCLRAVNPLLRSSVRQDISCLCEIRES